jgi:hypothetical protein
VGARPRDAHGAARTRAVLSALLQLGFALALFVGGAHRPTDPTPAVGGGRHVRAATTAPGAERVRTIPITRAGDPTTVLSLDPGQLGLRSGGTLHVYGEVQVSLTCIDPSLPRCIGSTYRFSPVVEGGVVLGPNSAATSEPSSVPIGGRQTVRCRAQPIADRNHHCVLVFDEVAQVPDRSRLPCRPRSCFLNMVVSAASPRAQSQDKLVIGADERDGRVRRNRGRLAAVVIPAGAAPAPWTARTARVRHHELPELQDGGLRVVYSVRLPALRRGDVLAARASQVTSIRRLRYAAFLSDQLILARGPDAVRPASPSPAANGGYLTAANGFNCTQGPSAYRTPCLARKAGAIEVVGPATQGPYYVNLVSRSKPKHSTGRPGDFARILPRGFLDVTRYR